MTDKPEVVAYGWEHRGRHACVDPAYAAQLMGDGEQVYALIRLTDHEAARAADKARIAEMEVILARCRPVMRAHAGASHLLEGFKPRRNTWDDLCDAIDAALAQQGKEGGV